MPFTIDENGIQTQTLDEVVAELYAALRRPAPDGFGPDFVLEPTEVVPMVMAIMAEREVALQNRVKEWMANQTPGEARGVHADNLAAVTGTTRSTGSPSTVQMQLDGTPLAVIPAGLIFQHNPTATLWVLAAAVTLDGSGEGTATVPSQENKAIDITSGTDWTIVTSDPGLTSVQATADSEEGSEGETDEALEEKRIEEIGQPGTSTHPALKADVQETLRAAGYPSANVDRVFVNNREIWVDGRPPGSGEVLIDDNGLIPDQVIAAAIWSAIGLGIRPWGNIQVDYVDAEGETRDVRYSRASNVEVWIRVTCDTTGAEEEIADQTALTAAIQAAIVAYGDANHPSGRNVIPGPFAGPAYNEAPGAFEGGVVAEVSIDGVAWSTSPIAISTVQRAAFDASRVAVVYTP